MKSYYEIKTIDNSVLDIDDASRRVKTVLNRVSVKDFDNDVIERTGFDRTIKERGPEGKNLIWHLTDHNPTIKTAVGKFSELYMDGDDLVGVTNIPKTTWGNDVLEHYKVGNINQHSIGFKTIDQKKQKDSTGEYNLILEVMLHEGSAVLWGANEFTPTRSVGKSLTKQEKQDEAFKAWQELERIEKSLRNGKFSDDEFAALDVYKAQLKEKLTILLTPIQETTGPESATLPEVKAKDEVEAALEQINKQFKNYLNGRN